MSASDSYGKGFGNILGVSSFITSFGGILAGGLYKYQQGDIALVIISLILLITLVISVIILPNKKINKKVDKFVNKNLFLKLNKKIYIICLMIFLQQFVSAPMWNFIIPMYFYTTFQFTAYYWKNCR